jgi:hypothetical protein
VSGRVVGQRDDEETRLLMDASDIAVTVIRGELDTATRRRARARVVRAMRVAPSPALHGRVTLAVDPDPAVARKALAAAAVDVGGRLILCRAEGATTDEAIDLLAARLRGRLRKLTGLRVARRRASRGCRPVRSRSGA